MVYDAELLHHPSRALTLHLCEHERGEQRERRFRGGADVTLDQAGC